MTTELEPAGFFVLRTPFLPFDELESWGRALAAPDAASGPEPALAAALGRDRAALRRRLADWLRRPTTAAALRFASPSLVRGLPLWQRQPESRKGRRIETSVVRYFVRMASRATPFGLFAGCSLGTLGAESRLRLAERAAYRRRTAVDVGYLRELARWLAREARLRPLLGYRPNPALCRAAGRLRYYERCRDGAVWCYRWTAVEAAGLIEDTLRRALPGPPAGQLIADLTAAGMPGEKAEALVAALIDSQLLVDDLAPAVTGGDPLESLAGRLAQLGPAASVARQLADVREALAQLDGAGVGAAAELDGALRRRLAFTDLGFPEARRRSSARLHVDLTKPVAVATLGPEVTQELRRGVELLHLLAPPAADPLAPFRRAFLARWGAGREVPLLEVLDPDVGIGVDGRPSGASPLLEGLDLAPPAAPAASPGRGARDELLAGELARALAEGRDEIELRDEDFAGLGGRRAPLPDSFQVMARLAAASEEALRRGELRLLLRGTYGPSGARLLGRFTHVQEELRELVESYLRREEEADPEAVFAEVAYLPADRAGEVHRRPLLRAYEIPCLGRSGAAEERQIPLADLRVAVAGDEVVLRSARLGRRVVPRVTSAHVASPADPEVYRFLWSLQSQGVVEELTWDWGLFDSFPFLPRVASGRLVLTRARWRVTADEIAGLGSGDPVRRFRAAAEWRRRRRIPRWAVLADGDREWVVDFDNVLAVETFAALIRGRPRFVLTELFPGPGELCVEGPEGRFVHELVIPFRRRGRRRKARAEHASAAPPPPVRRAFVPGSEWLAVELYTGVSTADRVLRRVAGPLARQATESGAADGWFFVRFDDPHRHLRLRFHGDPRRLRGEVLPALERAVAPLMAGGEVWRWRLATYEREVERYGGAAGIELAERVAHVDSEAVLAILDRLAGAGDPGVRWRLALVGMDLLLADLGWPPAARLGLVEELRRSRARELGLDLSPAGRLRRQLADRWRRERRALAAVGAAREDRRHPLAPALAALERRSLGLRPLAAELRRRGDEGLLGRAPQDLAADFVHMFCNRLLESEGFRHELVLYDFLGRHLRSRTARGHGDDGLAAWR